MKIFLQIFLGVAFLSGSVAGKELVGIAAVVNDSVISVLDLVARTKMVTLSSGFQDSLELREQLVGPVLQNLIEEKLQVQEAERRGISVTEEELAAALEVVARQNGVLPDQLGNWLASIGLPAIYFEDQIRAQLLWAKVVSTDLGPQVNVTEEEVEQEFARLEENRGNPEYLVSQIDFYFSPSRTPDDLLLVAEQLVDQINAGASFEAVAQQFSDNALASFGGDMGWVSEAQVLPELGVALSEMKPGQVSTPIMSASGVHVVKLREQRKIMEADIGQVRVNLVQIVLTSLSTNSVGSEHEVLAEEISNSVRGCDAMEAMAERLDPESSGNVGWVSLKDLPEQFRRPLAELDVGMPSKALLWRDRVHIMMVCQRENNAASTDYATTIRSRMEQSRLETLAKRLLRDLRRSALVDVRV